MISPELKKMVIKEISPKDDMYAGNESHYFGVGLSALENIEAALLLAKKNASDIKSVLDLPCGYGRVLRALKAMFPEAEITACDLNKEGVDFCHNMLGAKRLYSSNDPQKIKTENKYDLIWCGSLLTHLDFSRWGAFLDFFQAVLNQKGVLVFTAHGRFLDENISSGKNTYGLEPLKLKLLLDNYNRNGYSYVNYPQSNDYGISMSSASYVMAQAEKLPGLRILLYKERGWDDHQDVIACVKI